MKFEDQVNNTIKTLEEEVPPMTMGNPPPVNPSAVAPPISPTASTEEQGPTADQLMQFALNSDPNKLKDLGIDPNIEGDDLFKAVHTAYIQNSQQPGAPNAQMNPVAASNNQQTTSAQPVSTNTSGMQGAIQTGI